MTTDPLADVVTGQYEKWVYPEPIRDLPDWLAGNWQWFDPSHAHRMFWPDRDFDLIVSTGVLHHMASPEVGMQALARCLRPDGVAAIMLYARYGRIGVEMLQSTFRELGLRQDEASLAVVRAAIAALPQDHPVKSYMAVAPDLTFDAGLVDTFLHGRDRSYTVADCLDLVTSAGLVFQEWFLKSSYYPPAGSADPFYARVAALPEEQQWSIMERVNTRNGCHFFTACRPERPRATYRVDVASEAFLDRVPEFRYRCGFRDGEVFRYDWKIGLDPVQQALIRQVDGRRTIREILALTGPLVPDRTSADLERFARTFFRSIVQRDFLALGLPPIGRPAVAT